MRTSFRSVVYGEMLGAPFQCEEVFGRPLLDAGGWRLDAGGLLDGKGVKGVRSDLAGQALNADAWG